MQGFLAGTVVVVAQHDLLEAVQPVGGVFDPVVVTGSVGHGDAGKASDDARDGVPVPFGDV